MRICVPLWGGARLSFPLWVIFVAWPFAYLAFVVLVAVSLGLAILWLIRQLGRTVMRWWRRYPDIETRLANLPWPP